MSLSPLNGRHLMDVRPAKIGASAGSAASQLLLKIMEPHVRHPVKANRKKRGK